MKGSQLKVARRYARALFELCESSQLDDMQAALITFAALWEKEGALRDALQNPAFALDERLQSLRTIAAMIKPADQSFVNFLAALLENKRIRCVGVISVVFAGMIAEFRKLLTLEITSAFELPDDDKRAVQSRVLSECGAGAVISWKVDKSIVGGLLIKSGDKLLDGSIKGSLERVRARMFA